MRSVMFILLAIAGTVSAAPATYAYVGGSASQFGGGTCDEAPFVAGLHRGGVCYVDVGGPVRVSVRDEVTGLVAFGYMFVGGDPDWVCDSGFGGPDLGALEPGACNLLHVFAPAGSAKGTIEITR